MATQANQTSQAVNTISSNVLRCPRCESLHLVEDQQSASIRCENCQQSYPLLTFGKITIPFLFANVSVALFDWCARINGFNQKINQEIASLHENIKEKNLSKISKQRLKNILYAKKQYQEQVLTHMQCFENFKIGNIAIQSTEIAKNQGVDSYVNNIFRDWCWENGENQEMLSTVEAVVDENYQAGQCVTLGAGAGKLSFDFHFAYKAEHSVLVDINPMLLGSAKRIFNNEKVILNEFPVAPLSAEEFSVEHSCQNKSKICLDDFTFILADGLNAPIKSKIFDTVLTPWFIDIVPIDLKQLIPHVSRLLKIGGTWVNTGSLAFFHKNQSWNYSQQEVVDLLKKFGFHEIIVSRKNINYLHSPHSAHGRVECVFSFSAKKKFDSVNANPVKYLPDWIEDVNLSIPQQSHLSAIGSRYLLQAQVLSAIDGTRSIMEIGCLLAKQYDMDQNEAIAAVKQIFVDQI